MRDTARQRMISQINVVPYIDVMLVLLVIFMVVAPLTNPNVVNLPSIGQSSQTPPAPLEVIIKSDQTLFLRDRAKGSKEQQIDQEDLADVIKLKQSNNPDQPVLIAGDKKVSYEIVLYVMGELQKQNVKKIGLLVKPVP